MDNLSTASNVISSQIGALELDYHLEGYGDGVLEASMAGPGTTAYCHTREGGCTFHCISDGALESFGAAIGTPATAASSGCSTFYCPTRLCFQ
jgi:hypothetical protein